MLRIRVLNNYQNGESSSFRAALFLFLGALQLHLRCDKFVFDIIEVILFFVNNSLKLLISRDSLEIIVRNVEIEKKMSHIYREWLLR